MLNLSQFKDKLRREGTADWSEPAELEYFWSYEMKASREEIWVYLSDTSRFNRELGFGPREQTEREGKQFVSTTMMGQAQEWIEEPWTWLAGQTMGSVRTYVKGMAKTVHSVFHIEDAGDHRVVYIYFGWKPASPFWAMFLRASGGIIQKKFGEAFVKIDRLVETARERLENQLVKAAPALTEVTKVKLDQHRHALLDRGMSARTVDMLCELIGTADDLEVESIKVIPLSRRWSIPQRELLATCLHATRLGLLNISWEVICPHCRGSRFSAENLGAIPDSASCDVCDLDFATDDAESIEVMFHVHPSIRQVPTLLFCAAEPAKKHHIKIQQHIGAGRSLDLSLNLKPGLYRARLLGDPREARLEVDQMAGARSLDVALSTDPERAPVAMAPEFALRYANDLATTQTFVLEELWWENQALKPAHVLALPDFRDLFASEHLNSNVKLFLGEQTILFTDIVGSTKFYAEVGDAKAFREVRNHFQEVFKDVQAHSGIVVKTIGDAVMASFPGIQEAMEAAISIQKRFFAERADTAIRLRISVHCGPVIAVQLNTGIDYFGNTVNHAAKIQSVAGAGEIALSEMVYALYTQEMTEQYPVQRRRNSRDGAVASDIYVIKVAAAGAGEAGASIGASAPKPETPEVGSLKRSA